MPARPTVLLKNSIIAGNESEIAGWGCGWFRLRRRQHHLRQDVRHVGPELIVADPLLGDLADNGGPTQTRALDRNSPAINATDCSDVTVDQRFVARDARCDIGPFDPSSPRSRSRSIRRFHVDPSTGAVTFGGTIQCSRNETFNLAVEVKQPKDQAHSGRGRRDQGHRRRLRHDRAAMGRAGHTPGGRGVRQQRRHRGGPDVGIANGVTPSILSIPRK